MASRVILEYDGRNAAAKSIVQMLQTVGFFKISIEKTGMEATKDATKQINRGKGTRHKTIESIEQGLKELDLVKKGKLIAKPARNLLDEI